MPYRPLSITLLHLAAAASLVGAETAMAPTPAKPPRPVGPTNHLVDRVIPAYGMNVARSESGQRSAAELYQRAHAFAGDVETRIMSGTLRRGTPSQAPSAADAKNKKKDDEQKKPEAGATAQPGARQPLLEEQQLLALWDEATKLHQQLQVPDSVHAIPEQAYLDAAFSDLARAAESLRLGLGDDTYTALEGEHSAWLSQYAAALNQARAAKIQELMSGPKKMSQRDAEAAVQGMTFTLSDEQVARMPAAPAAPAPDAAAPATAPGAPAAPSEPSAREPAPAAPTEAAAPAPTETPAEMPAETATDTPAEMPPAESAAPSEPEPEQPAPAEPEPTPSEPAPADAAPTEPEAAAPSEPAAEPAAEPEATPSEPAPAEEASPAPSDSPSALPDL